MGYAISIQISFVDISYKYRYFLIFISGRMEELNSTTKKVLKLQLYQFI